MSDLFDEGIGAEEMGLALGLAEEMAEEKREQLRLLKENENQPLIPEDEKQWYED